MLLLKNDSQAASESCLKSFTCQGGKITYEYYDLSFTYGQDAYRLVIKPTNSKNTKLEMSDYTSSTYKDEQVGVPWIISTEFPVDNVKELVIGEGISKIGDYSFCGMSRIEKISFPSSLTTIGAYAFQQLVRLENLEIPDSVTCIKKGAFASSRGLRKVKLPNNLKIISGETFFGCNSIKEVNIPKECVEIQDSAFSNCEDISSLELGQKIEKIGKYAFNGCNRIVAITLPSSLKQLGYNALPMKTLTSITFDNVKLDEDYTFNTGKVSFYDEEGQPFTIIKAEETYNTTITSSCKITFKYMQRAGFSYSIPDVVVTGRAGEKLPQPQSVFDDIPGYHFEWHLFVGCRETRWDFDDPLPDYSDDEFEGRLVNNKYRVLYEFNLPEGIAPYSGSSCYTRDCYYDTEYQTPSGLTSKSVYYPGHVFKEWNTSPDGSGKSYKAQETVKNLSRKDGDVVKLYAIWDVSSITICFQPGEGTTGSMENISFMANEKVTLPTVKFKKEGYYFRGWSVRKSNYYINVDFCDQALISWEEAMDDCTVNLYAVWEPIQYSVAFNGNGATSGKMNDGMILKYNEVKNLPNNAFIRYNYIFTGWNTKADGSGRSFSDGQTIQNLTLKRDECITLYAQWEHSYGSYCVSFDGNGATSGKMDDQTIFINESTKLNSCGFSKTGYTFEGWSTSIDGDGENKNYKDGEKVTNLTDVNNGKVTLYAQWKDDIREVVEYYKITYQLNGGKNSSKNPKSYTNTSDTINLFAATRKGYKFAGWYSDSKFKNKVTAVKKGSSGNKTFYAKWTPVTYKIRFDKNGAKSGFMKNLTVTYDKKVKLSKNTYKRSGYTFLGWSTNKKAKKADYKNMAAVKNLSFKDKECITLYAVWQKEKVSKKK